MSTPTLPSRARPGNPFRVYPVAILNSDQDILSWTVHTPGIESLRTEMTRFVAAFGSGDEGAGASVPLILGVSGAAGSGKTHLIRYFKAVIENELPGGVSLMLRATETSWRHWYQTECAHGLRELSLPKLFIDLLAHEAIAVAKVLPATLRTADALAKEPLRVFEVLRDGDISRTDVERRFLAAISASCGKGSAELRTVLGLLNKREVSAPAMDWLTCRPIDEGGITQLQVAGPMQIETDAIPFLSAIAAVCRRLGRVFFICIDELERLTGWDQRPVGGGAATLEQRNSEWLRKLAEGIADSGGALIFAGQPRAWQNQPNDLLDRVSTRPLLALASWDAQGVRRLVDTAGADWLGKWDERAFAKAAAITGGNIRRLQTILYELFVTTADDSNARVDETAVIAAAARLRRPDQPPDLLEAACRAAEAGGGTVERGVEPLEGLVLDVLIRKSGVPHLAVRRGTASDEAELARSGVEFNQQISRLRREQATDLRGLLIVQGANDPQIVETLGHYSTLSVIDGEAPDAEDKVKDVTARRMAEPVMRIRATAPATVTADSAVAAEALAIAERSAGAKIAQRIQLAAEHPELAGREGALAQGGLDVGSAEQDLERTVRAKILQHFSDLAEKDLPLDIFLVRAGIRFSPILVLIAVLVWVSLNSRIVFGTGHEFEFDSALQGLLLGAIFVLGLAELVLTFSSALKLYARAAQARRNAFNLVEELTLLGVPTADLARARTSLDAVIEEEDDSSSRIDLIRDQIISKLRNEKPRQSSVKASDVSIKSSSSAPASA